MQMYVENQSSIQFEEQLASVKCPYIILITDGKKKLEELRPGLTLKLGRGPACWGSSSVSTKAQANPDPGHTLLMGLKGFT